MRSRLLLSIRHQKAIIVKEKGRCGCSPDCSALLILAVDSAAEHYIAGITLIN